MVQDKGKLVHSHPANELTEKQFGIESVINKRKTIDATTTVLVINSDAVPSGKIWKLTYVSIYNDDGDIATRCNLSVITDSTAIKFYEKIGATSQLQTVDKVVELYLAADDYISAAFIGVASPETCHLCIFGYEMNAP